MPVKSLSDYIIRLLLVITCYCFFPKAYSQFYFQQKVNYRIDVTLNDKKHELSASETVEYINNSPDTLNFIYFHLWPNGYSNNTTDLALQIFSFRGKEKLFNDAGLKGYIDSLDFLVNGQTVQWDFLPGQPDICKILLNEYLGPGDSITISTPFHVKIPMGVTSRLGHIGESYQISQWYPKPAVYDINGWHQMPYLDQGEFYSEFGDFEVNITLPDNYIVGASGDLQNEQEALRLDILTADTSRNSSYGNKKDYFPTSADTYKTLQYKSVDIHDFAWFADKRFHVLKGAVTLPETGKLISTMVMFTNEQEDLWKDALGYVNNAILYFSSRIGDYPYNTFTAVQSALTAGAGMEYPGITVIGLAEDAYSLEDVLAHEACHNWFYSAIGSDERRFPFMDEGITAYYEVSYMAERYPGRKLWESYFTNRKIVKFLNIDEIPAARIAEIEWLAQSRQNLEQPLNLSAPEYSYQNYSTIIYLKAAIGFNYLKSYLGEQLFDSLMQDYYLTWKSKHPAPSDLRHIFESGTGKDLSWFFDDFIGTTKRLDYKISKIIDNQILIKNKGELISPLLIAGLNGDSIFTRKWTEGFSGSKWIRLPIGDFHVIKIDPDHESPELYRLNNNIRSTGIFRKADPVRLQLLYTIEDPDKRTILYMPAVNWTREDGFMAGVAFHNRSFINRPVEFFLMPFYTFKDQGLAGLGRMEFSFLPYDSFIRMAKGSIEATRFGAPGNQNYNVVKSGIDLQFKTKVMNNPLAQSVYSYFISASDLSLIALQKKAGMLSYMQTGYIAEKLRIINPYKLQISLESGKSYQKAAIELNYRYSYYGKNNGLDIRLFSGMMLKNNQAVSFYSFSPSGRGGPSQYLYQGTYPDRFGVFPNTFFSRQMICSEGAMVSPLNDSIGYSDWLISASFTSNFPGKAGQMPVKPFVNILLNDHGNGTNNNSHLFFEAGLKAGIWNLFEVYVPLLVSENISLVNGSFKSRIRIVLNLESLYQKKLISWNSN